eukprot:GFKZ01015556.1.p2 GENE.GFKZ01015556.1~~GFKZ01015556.1.p2  ORF type:complete len:410 (+),score=75.20 GFKZ01015556.1:274-1503(+)
MEAFVPSSSFAPRRLCHSKSLSNFRPSRPFQHAQTICMAKKSKRAKKPASEGSKPKSSSSSFAGLAAGPAQQSSSPRPSLRRKKSDQTAESDSQRDPTTDASETPTPRVTRALGTRAAREPVVFKKKTAAEFLAEGVEDDVEGNIFAQADIRFGINDVKDPFKIDADKEGELKRKSETQSDIESIGVALDITGDASVNKVLQKPGEGDIVTKGAKVIVHYTGKLEDGTVFDSSRNKDDPFEFELGAGKVIKGWEAGVATMRKGEISQFTIAPSYAYGRRGMPPVIPSNATLTFDIELIDCFGGESQEIKRVAEFNPEVARTPEEIARDYDARIATKEQRRKAMSFFERFYIISPFASQSGEKPPWWVNPNITSVIILAFTAVGFYLVVKSGAIHIGYVDQPVDVNIFNK